MVCGKLKGKKSDAHECGRESGVFCGRQEDFKFTLLQTEIYELRSIALIGSLIRRKGTRVEPFAGKAFSTRLNCVSVWLIVYCLVFRNPNKRKKIYRSCHKANHLPVTSNSILKVFLSVQKESTAVEISRTISRVILVHGFDNIYF